MSAQSTSVKTSRQQFNSSQLIPITADEDFTYQRLKAFHLERNRSNKVGIHRSEQVLSNELTAINQWCRQLGLADESSIGPEFGIDFDLRLNAHLRWLDDEGKSETTINDRKSKLKARDGT